MNHWPSRLAVPRSRWRAYLLLSRVSNLPTVWSNVLAGVVAAQAPFGWSQVARLSVGVSCLYTAGMFLNDALDRQHDALHRPTRPIPAGDVSLRAATVAGAALLIAGLLIVIWQPQPGAAAAWAVLLAGMILFYDYHHKGSAVAPIVMGVCRGLVYCVAAAAVSQAVDVRVAAAAAVLVAYVTVLTLAARSLGPRAGTVVPLLIAGISLVDAAVVLLLGGEPWLAAGAASMGPLTLFLQRFVPGD